MASKQLTEEFLTCIICHEVFRDPVTLHCGHSFCNQCITAYTKTQKQAIVEQCIPCPTCHQLTTVPDLKLPVGEWAGQIKTGLFVKGLVADRKRPLCTICKDDGKTVHATVCCLECNKDLCADCEKYHKKFFTGHNTKESTWKEASKPRGQPCPEHDDSAIDMICEDCDKALCQMCCVMYHRKCKSIIALKEAMPKLKTELENEENDLTKRIESLTAMVAVKKFQANSVDEAADKAQTDITSWTESLVSTVREKASQLTDNLNQTKTHILGELMNDVTKESMELEDAKQRQVLIHSALSSMEISHYELHKICKQNRCKHQSQDEKEQSKRMLHLRYDATEAENLLNHMEKASLGEIHVSHDGERHASVTNGVKKEMESKNELVKTTKKKIDMSAERKLVQTIETAVGDHGLALMTVQGKTVVVCASGRFIKSFDLDGSTLKQGCIFLDSSVTGFCQIDESRGVASLSGLKKIVFFKVTPQILKEDEVATQQEYGAITYIGSSKFAAGYEFGIDVIDSTGIILRNFEYDNYEDDMSSVSHMSSTNTAILVVSDGRLNVYTDLGYTMKHTKSMNAVAVSGPSWLEDTFLMLHDKRNTDRSYNRYTYTVSLVTTPKLRVTQNMFNISSYGFDPHLLAVDQQGLVCVGYLDKIDLYGFK